MYPYIATKHTFAGGRDTQTYIQMRFSLRKALHAGVKRCTRRIWGARSQNMHVRAYHEGTLVAVTGQGHHTTIGYLLYTNITASSVGTVLTADDLKAEGSTAKSDMEFRKRWYRSRVRDPCTGQYRILPDSTRVHILSFVFYSIVAQ